MKRWPWVVLTLSLLAFVSLSGWFTARLGTWHEENSVFPTYAARTIDEGPHGEPAFKPSCGAAAPSSTIISRERPEWTRCVGARAMPIMVSSYIGGWIYWPAELLRAWHGDNVLRLRWIGVLFGVIELITVWVFLRRVGGELLAAGAVAAIALSPPFVYLHALLVEYEITPWMFVALAVLVWLPPRGGQTTPGRFIAGSLLVGLAFAGNVKAAFVLLPLAAYALVAGHRFPRTLWRWVPLALLAAALPILPLWRYGTLDPTRGFEGQIHRRLGSMARSVLSRGALLEPLNLVRYWADFPSYFDEIEGRDTVTGATWLVPALSLLYALVHAARACARRAHDEIAAGCGFLFAAYLVVVVCLYTQHPDANYGPLHAIFGVATAVFCLAAGRWLAGRSGGRVGEGQAAIAMFAVAAAGFAYDDLKGGDPSKISTLSFNIAAQQALARSLLADEALGDTLTTTYNIAGVPDSFSAGRLHTIQAHRYFDRCRDLRGDAARTCLIKRWRTLLAAPELRHPLSVITPIGGTMIDERYAPELIPSLTSAVAEAGSRIVAREDFRNGDGVAVLSRLVLP